MNERELIEKIELLREIKPNNDWVSSVRRDLLKREKSSIFETLFVKRAVVASLTLSLIGGLLFYSSEVRMNREIEKMVKENEVEILSIALLGLKDAKADVGKSFSEAIANKPEEEVVKIARATAPSLLEIEEREEVIAQSLGVMIDSDDLLPNKEVAAFLISDLERRSLTEEENLLLSEAKDAFANGHYRQALKRVLEIGETES